MGDQPTYKNLQKRISELETSEIEYKAKLEALEESENDLRSILDNIPCIAYRCALDREWTMSILNKNIKQVTGYNPSDFINNSVRSYESIIHRADTEYVAKKVNQAVESGKPWEIEYRIIHKDGTPRWVYEKGIGITDENARLKFLEGIIFDITNRKKAEETRERILDQQKQINNLQEYLLGPDLLTNKINSVTNAVVSIFNSDFCRIWIKRPGDLCDSGCTHRDKKSGQDICSSRQYCLHLEASSGRYTHTDGSHKRVPIGAYKIGRLSAAHHIKFLTNNVAEDKQIHDHQWARKLGLQSFAGYQLRNITGECVGVLALFSKNTIAAEEDALLESIGNSVAQVIQTSIAEDSLKESEEKYRKIFNNEIDAIMVFDILSRRVLDVNNAFLSLYGYTQEEALSICADDVSLEPEKSREAIKEAACNTNTLIPVRHHKTKDGTPITVEISAVPFSWKGQKIMFAVIRDITKYIKAKEALLRSEEKFSKAFQMGPDSILITRRKDNRIINANEQFLLSTGYSQDEVLGKTSSTIIDWVKRQDQEVFERLLQDTGQVNNLETNFRNKNGAIVPFLISARQIEVDGEECIISITRDISDLKEAEEARAKMNLQLRQAHEAGMAEMAAEVLHNIGNAITPVHISTRGLLNTLRKSPLCENLADLLNEYCDIIKASSSVPEDKKNRLIEIAKELPELMHNQFDSYITEVEKISTKHEHIIDIIVLQNNYSSMPAILEEVDLNQLLGDALQMLEESLKVNVITIDKVFANLEKIKVEKSKLIQVLINLIKNAQEATYENTSGDRRITIKTYIERGENDFVICSIKDNGCGFTTEQSAKFFSFGYTSKKSGCGFGLHSCANYLISCGGEIKAHSDGPGLGAEFKIKLPVMREA